MIVSQFSLVDCTGAKNAAAASKASATSEGHLLNLAASSQDWSDMATLGRLYAANPELEEENLHTHPKTEWNDWLPGEIMALSNSFCAKHLRHVDTSLITGILYLREREPAVS